MQGGQVAGWAVQEILAKMHNLGWDRTVDQGAKQ